MPEFRHTIYTITGPFLSTYTEVILFIPRYFLAQSITRILKSSMILYPVSTSLKTLKQVNSTNLNTVPSCKPTKQHGNKKSPCSTNKRILTLSMFHSHLVLPAYICVYDILCLMFLLPSYIIISPPKATAITALKVAIQHIDSPCFSYGK